MHKKILIVIPCFNEAHTIGNLIEEIQNEKSLHPFDFDIIVINDCSTDNTPEEVKKYNVINLDLPINLGIGGAMQMGYKYALKNNYQIAIQVDGDGQHPPKEIVKLINQYLLSNDNVIIGSRFILKQGFQSSILRRIGITYLHWLNRLLTGKSIFDITSGFRLFDIAALEIAAKNYPDEYPEPESLIIFSKYGLSINEIPVIMRDRQGGESSIKNFGQLYYMFKVSIAMFFSHIKK